MSTPPTDPAPSGAPADASRDFWIGHALTTTGNAAVLPSGKWIGYHRWTLAKLQSWTLGRVLADRPRYRRCLDLGCGRGDWAAMFAPHADEVFACDVAPTFVEETRARLAAMQHPAVTVEQADLRTYPIPAGVDLVYFGSVLLYLTDGDVLALLRRVREAAAPGALVIIRDYCTINLGRPSTQDTNGFSTHRRPRELVALAEQAGLRFREQRCSTSIYGEVMARGVPGVQWVTRGLWRLATAHWRRSSYVFVFRT